MTAADELYLLSQKSNDLCDNVVNKWQKNFDWLKEVILTAKQARGEIIIPKTPARKKRAKKNEDTENKPPPPPPADCVRKSSRAAAKVAQTKNKQALIEISNLNSKIRRPSTPPKVVQFSPLKKSLSDNEDDKCDEDPKLEDKESCDVVSVLKPVLENLGVDQIKIMKKERESSGKPANLNESDESGIYIQEMPPPSLNVYKVTEKLLKKEELRETTVRSPSPKFTKPTRVTRTKKRVIEESEQNVTPVRSTRSKKRKLVENITEYVELDTQISYKNEEMNLNVISVKKEGITRSPHVFNTKETNVPNTATIPQRITRSKVRPLTPQKASPAKHKNSPHRFTPNKNNNHTSKNRLNSPLISNTYSGSPKNKALQSKSQNVKNVKKHAEIHEVSVESVKVVSSPGRVVKHKKKENTMSDSSKVVRNKISYQTPSPSSSSAAKILGHTSVYGSVGLQSAYSQKRKKFLCSSPQILGTKVIGTPTEVNRTKNILMGPSFLTKVQPSKPTKEETEDRKQEEMRRKREREEETRKKKEELLRIKMEEQKRKNEDRMRRVQEARELREKKVAEAREMQERERKQRDDRIKDERKKRLVEAKKNEEMKQLLKKQAEEEQRLKEERRLREEQKLRDEQRLIEELKAMEEFKKIEERRKLEERKLEEKREAERIMKEKLKLVKAKETERIAREKKELEQLRLKESERLQSEQKMNETYNTSDTNALNSTYSKPTTNITQKSNDLQSYEMTPDVVKKAHAKSKNTNDYGITDLRSDDSTDDETAPKKKIPSWAQGSQLRKHLFDQEHFPPSVDHIFHPDILLQMPDLTVIFPKRRSRFTKRTSSAVWNTPPYKLLLQK